MTRLFSIPANPAPFLLQTDGCALLVIDMQRDFLHPGGFGASLGNDVAQLLPVVDPIRRILEAWRAHQWLVVHTREGHQADLSDLPPAKRRRGPPGLCIGDPGPMGRILIQGEPGHAIIDELAPAAGEIIIDKPGKGAFWDTDLHQRLQADRIQQLVITGVTTEVCVQTTAREANDRGYECLILSDATASYFPAFHDAALAMMQAQGGIVGWVSHSHALLSAIAHSREYCQFQ